MPSRLGGLLSYYERGVIIDSAASRDNTGAPPEYEDRCAPHPISSRRPTIEDLTMKISNFAF
jgi:hypothetical protein